MANGKKRVEYDIVSRDRSKAGTDSARRNLSGLKGDLDGMRTAFTAFSAVAATFSVGALVRESAAAAAELDQTRRRLEGVLTATQNAAGFTLDELQVLAEQLERSTLFDRNEIMDAMSILATFKSVTGETFEDTIELALDMSTVFQQDLRSSITQLAKAVEDPVKGFTALARVGVTFTEQQIEMIKAADEANNKLLAQGEILETLEKQVGGTAANVGGGVTGAVDALGASWRKLLEAVGATGQQSAFAEAGILSLASALDVLTESMAGNNKALERLKILREGFTEPLWPEEGVEAGTDFNVQPPEGFPEVTIAPGAQGKTAQQQAAEQAAADKKLREERAAAAKAWAAESQKLIAEEIRHADSLDALRWQWHEDEKARKLEAIRVQADWVEWNDEAINDAIEGGRELAEERQRAHDDYIADLESRGQALIDSIWFERGQLNGWLKEQSELLDELLTENLISKEDHAAASWLLTKEFQERETAIVQKEARARFGISQYYNRLDLESTAFFFGNMAALMETQSSTLFKIGKRAAQAETLIQTYKAAQGAYAALSAIPIVGPALGIAAAAAATLAGLARVQAIESIELGSAGGAVATFAGSPTTGLPTAPPGTAGAPLPSVGEPVAAPQARNVFITLGNDGTPLSDDYVRNVLIPAINEAGGDGFNVNVR